MGTGTAELQNALRVPQGGTSGGTYQKQLTNATFVPEEAPGFGKDSSALATALGVAGSTLQAGLQAQEARNEKVGVYEAEQIINSKTPQDVAKLNAIDMIGTHNPDAQLQDNPYAIATIEKMRGQYLSSDANDEYSTWRATQPKVKTAQEEINRYNDFISARHKDSLDTTTNVEAFNAGFNEKQPSQELMIASQQRTEHANELKVINKGVTQGALASLVGSATTLAPTDFTTQAQVIMDKARIAWMPPADRVDMLQQAGIDIAKGSGEARYLDALGEVQVGTNDTGDAIHAKDVMDMNPLKLMAAQRTANIFGERVQSDLEKLQKMNHAQQNEYYANLQATDPQQYEAMLQYRHPAYKFYDEQQKIKAKAALKAQANSAAQAQMSSNIRQQLDAWKSNNLKDAGGRTVASSPGGLPEINITETDENGNLVTKKLSYDSVTLNNAASSELSSIQNRNDLTDDEKGVQALHLLSFPPFTDFRKAVENQFTTAIDGVTVKQLETDPEGWVNANGQTLSTLKMYRVDPDGFQKAFGEQLTLKTAMIQALADGSGGDYARGLSMYAQGRANLQDPKFVSTTQSAITKDMQDNPPKGFNDLNGNSGTLGDFASNNRYAAKLMEDQMLVLMASGQSMDSAHTNAVDALSKTHSVYETTLIPNNMFNDIPTSNDDKAGMGKKVLDYYLDDFLKTSGMARESVSIEYDPRAKCITFGGPNQFKSYTMNDIGYSGAQMIDWQNQAASDNASSQPQLSEAEIAAAKAADEQSQDATAGTPYHYDGNYEGGADAPPIDNVAPYSPFGSAVKAVKDEAGKVGGAIKNLFN
jgi:hypothetical protein